MKLGFAIGLATFLTCNIARAVYEILKKAGKIDIKSKPLFAGIFTVMCLLWMSWFYACPQDPLHLELPAGIKWFGLGIFTLGMFLALGAFFQLKGLENIDHLVTSGLFGKLRHPMYTGFMMWIIGWSIFHDAVISFFAGLICIGNILYWRQLEDNHLEKTYGELYTNYMKQTWF
jgi:protein-S-isoprenylcysteine O-methyltransferase Ste14